MQKVYLSEHRDTPVALWKIISRVMRITAFLLLVCALKVSAKSYSQDRITLNLKDVSITRVFSVIQEKTDYKFLYNNEDVQNIPLISISVRDATISQTLEECFKSFPLMYRFENKTIIIYKVHNENLNLLKKVYREEIKYRDLRPQFEISGKVVDHSGKPLAGVSVTLQGSPSIGTTTDQNGNYTLSLEKGTGTLIFTSVGFSDQEVQINGQHTINVSLEVSISSLNQVVVIGYGTQAKKDLTGAISVVDVNSVKAQPASSVTEALQGKAAGVNIINDGSPGSTPLIRIRGYSTINNNDPLYIIDGVPYEGNLNWLNQDDIQSIQVLKDASSASIYGSRANNGVVIITTKKGKEGPIQVTLNSYYGSSVPIRSRFPKFLTPTQYAEYLFRSYQNANLNPGQSIGIMYGTGSTPQLPEYLIAGNAAGMNVTSADADPSKYNHDPKNFYQITKANPNGTDWMREITRDAPVQNYQLGLSGGGKNSVYSLSFGYLDQQGIVRYTSFRRYNVRSNMEFHILKNHLTVGENILFSRTEGIGYSTNVGTAGAYQTKYDPVADVYKIQPIIPVYDIAGNFAGARGPTLGDAKNPLALLYRGKDNYTWENATFGNVYAETEIKGIKLRTSFGSNLTNYNSQIISYPAMEDAVSIPTNGYSATQGYGIQWTWTNTLNYHHVFNDVHLFNLLLGTESNRESDRRLTGSRNGYFLLGDQNYYYLSTGSNTIQNSEVGNLNSLFSIFARVDYSFKNRYLFSGTIRRDGSSKFGPLNRYGVFPAFSAAWRVSNESFMKSISWLNDLKLRVGYGETGNQNIPANNAFDLFTPVIASGSYPMNQTGSLTPGISQSQFGNASIEWERLKSGNVGIDFTVLNGAIDGSLDLYKRVTSGMLFPVPLPTQTVGMANSPFQNVGSMENKGIEVSVNYHHTPSTAKGNIFKWDLGLTVAHNSNMIRSLAPGVTHTIYGTDELTTTILEVGKPYGEFYGYKQDGIFQNSQEAASSTQPGARVGGMKYALINNHTAFSPDDRTYLGSPLPKVTYGINWTGEYKGFDVVLFFYGSQGNKNYNETKLFTDFQEFPSAASARLLNAWSPSNVNSLIPSASVLATPLEYQSSSYYVENGSYFRLKNLQIGYTFSRILNEISSLRIYGSVTNLFTITKYSGMDPEVTQFISTVQLPGVDLGVYPISRQYILGVNIKF